MASSNYASYWKTLYLCHHLRAFDESTYRWCTGHHRMNFGSYDAILTLKRPQHGMRPQPGQERVGCELLSRAEGGQYRYRYLVGVPTWMVTCQEVVSGGIGVGVFLRLDIDLTTSMWKVGVW